MARPQPRRGWFRTVVGTRMGGVQDPTP